MIKTSLLLDLERERERTCFSPTSLSFSHLLIALLALTLVNYARKKERKREKERRRERERVRVCLDVSYSVTAFRRYYLAWIAGRRRANNETNRMREREKKKEREKEKRERERLSTQSSRQNSLSSFLLLDTFSSLSSCPDSLSLSPFFLSFFFFLPRGRPSLSPVHLLDLLERVNNFFFHLVHTSFNPLPFHLLHFSYFPKFGTQTYSKSILEKFST